MKLKRFSQFINESYYAPGGVPTEREMEIRNELYRDQLKKRNDQFAKDNVDTPTFRTKEQTASAESVRSQIAGLGREDTLKLISICAGYVDPSQIEYVIDTVYNNEDFRRVRPSNGESSESLFSMIEDPKVARLALVPALSHAHNLGIDRSEIMEAIGSDPVDEMLEDEEDEYGSGQFSKDDFESDSWEEGHSAAERMINGSGGSTHNPHAEGSQEYAEFEAGFKAGLEAYSGMLPKSEFSRIA